MTAKPPDLAALVYGVYEKPLTPEEFDRRLAAMQADLADKEEIARLITWFTHRYPTVESRLRYVCKHAPRRSP